MAKIKLKYKYHGPVKRFGRIVIESKNFEKYTIAISIKQAINFFKDQAKQQLHLDRSAIVEILPELIEIVDVNFDYSNVPTQNKKRINPDTGASEHFTDGGFWEED